MRFVTVHKSDPQLRAYLLGTFSDSERALPIEFYVPAQNRPTITFRLETVAQCRKGVSMWRAWVQLSRWPSLSYSVGAVLLSLLIVPGLGTAAASQPGLLTAILLNLCVLHFAANALNDYVDHLRGVDRVQFRTGSRVIQNGWFAANTVFWTAVTLLTLALGLGLWVLSTTSLQYLWLGGIALLAVTGYSAARNELRQWGVSEALVFLICGPVLLGSFATVMTGSISTVVWALASWNGLVAAQQIFLRNWLNLQAYDRLQVKTLAVRLGADGCGKLFVILSIFRWALACAVAGLVLNPMTVTLAAMETWLLARSLTHAHRVHSSFSSELATLQSVVTRYSRWSLMAVLTAAVLVNLRVLFAS